MDGLQNNQGLEILTKSYIKIKILFVGVVFFNIVFWILFWSSFDIIIESVFLLCLV